MTGYLCKVTVKYAKPKTWREIIIPKGITFKDLHDIIQIVMGLSNYHLYLFKINNEYILDYSLNLMDMWDDMKTSDSKTTLIDDYFDKYDKIFYRYDFGDEWEFDIEIKNTVEYYRSFPTLKKYKGDYDLMEDCRAAGGWSYAMKLLLHPEDIEYEFPEYNHYLNYLHEFDKENVQEKLIEEYGDGKYMKGYDVKVRLDGFRPLTWRDLIIPSNITFKQLENIIQISMGIFGYHLSMFTFKDSEQKILDKSLEFNIMEYGEDINETIIDEYFEKYDKIYYEYDFNAGWSFTIEIKKSVDYDKPYPTLKRFKGKYDIIEQKGGADGLYEIIKHHENPNYKLDPIFEEYVDDVSEIDPDCIQAEFESMSFSQSQDLF